MTLSVVDHSDQAFKTMLLVELFKTYGSGDKVLLLRWVEQPLLFSYVPFEPLIFNKNNLTSDLVAHAAFLPIWHWDFMKTLKIHWAELRFTDKPKILLFACNPPLIQDGK